MTNPIYVQELTVFELTEDVTNPKADRRKTRDFRFQEIWPKGTRFRVEALIYSIAGKQVRAESYVPCEGYSHQTIESDGVRGQALRRFAKKVEPNLNERLSIDGIREWVFDAVKILIDRGDIDYEQLKEAALAAVAELEEN